MEKFKFHVEYKVGKTNYSTNLLETEHFKVDCDTSPEHIKLVMKSAQPLTISHLSVTIPYTFDKNDRIFANGFQSWTDCRELFTDDKPSCLKRVFDFVPKGHPFKASGDYTFAKYSRHRGEFHGFSYAYVRNAEVYNLFASVSERTGYTIFNISCPKNTVTAVKELEGVTIDGEYCVMDIVNYKGDENTVFDRWFETMGIAKARCERKNGYTTWYNYYPHINEQIVADDLEALSKVDSEIDIFQIDDGFQTAVGDWLSIDAKKFPNGMKVVADKIHEKNMLAGLWLAPLSCQYGSKVAKEHPDWLIKDEKGNPAKCGLNWGGFYGLDINVPGAREYIRHFFDVVLNEWGYDMVKLDFLYSASVVPGHGKSRGQLMCEAMDFIRECVGDKLILGCGVPLMPAFGKVDFCRVGADVGLSWNRPTFSHREDVSTVNTLGNTIFRRHLDGRAFRNDPDVFLLRDYNIQHDFEKKTIIATVNKVFGSLLFHSDNVSKYDDKQMELLLATFKKDDIKVTKAEFCTDDRQVLDIAYLENGIEKTLKFNLFTGKLS